MQDAAVANVIAILKGYGPLNPVPGGRR